MLVRIANWGETLIRLTASEEVWAVCLGGFFLADKCSKV